MQKSSEILDTLKVNPKNPRTITKQNFERLKDKIYSFPEMLEYRPIVYDENNVVQGGNSRLLALRELAEEGFEMKDAYFAKAVWDEADRKKFVIYDNISDGDWDMEILANEWDDEPLDDWGIDTGKFPSDVGTLQRTYEVVIKCEDEEEQTTVHDTLTERGYSCRIKTKARK